VEPTFSIGDVVCLETDYLLGKKKFKMLLGTVKNVSGPYVFIRWGRYADIECVEARYLVNMSTLIDQNKIFKKKGNTIKFKLNEDVKIGTQTIRKGSVLEVMKKQAGFHYTNIGSSLQRFADLNGFVPEYGDSVEDFQYDSLTQDDFESNPEMWEEFVQEAVLATEDAQRDLNTKRKSYYDKGDHIDTFATVQELDDAVEWWEDMGFQTDWDRVSKKLWVVNPTQDVIDMYNTVFTAM